MLNFDLCCSKTIPTLSEIQIKLLFYPKQHMVETICSQDKMHISLTSINLCGIFLCSQHFTFLKAKTEELETNHKIKNIRDLYRGINVFEKG